MSYLICVLNHKSRDVSHVSEYLSGKGLPFKVFTDNSDYKDKRATRWLGIVLNYLSILRHQTDAGWKIIMHDDLEFDSTLFSKIAHVLEFAPKSLISFYNPTNIAYVDCKSKGLNVLKTYANVWSQCHAFPRELEGGYLADCEAHPEYVSKYAEDGLLQRYLSSRKIPAYSVVPGLVQHAGYDRSTFGIPAKCGKNLRNSATFDRAFDVSKVDWKSAFENPYLNLITKSY